MPLPAVVESLDKVPEAIRGEYEQRDGKFVLRLDGEPPGFVPKSRIDEFRENNIRLTREKEQLAAQAERFKDLDPDKAREALAKLRDLEDKKLIDEGKIDELVAQRVERIVAEKQGRIEEVSKAYEKEKSQREAFEAELSRELIQRTVDDSALRHKVLPTALNIVRLLAQHGDHNGVRWTLDSQTRKQAAIKADGTPVWSAKDPTKPLEMDEWMADLVKHNPTIVPPSTGGGARGATAGGGSTADLSALPPVERLKALRRIEAA